MRQRRVTLKLLMMIVSLASPSLAGQRPGDLDTTFGDGGKAIHSGFTLVEDVVVLPDGKILVVGSVGTLFEHETFDIRIARYHADGSADVTFGTGGFVVTDFGGLKDDPRAVAIQPDGKIVVVGQHGYQVGCCELFYDLILVRYQPDGSLDASFGAGGKVIADLGRDNDYGADVAIQGDGKIVVAAFTGGLGGGPADFVVARYLPGGSPDGGFGLGGRTTTDFPAPYVTDGAESIVIQADGKILVGGWTGDLCCSDAFYDYALARYLPNGTLDPGFGQGGLVITDVGTRQDRATRVGVQPDGKIVLAGVIDDGLTNTVAIARYLQNGSLDGSFGAAGVARSNLGKQGSLGDMVIQADGRILVAGSSRLDDVAFDVDFTVLRYTREGLPDLPFGLDGRVQTDFESITDDGTAVALQADGKIIVVGDQFGAFSGNAPLIARYQAFGDVRPDVKVNGADYGMVFSPGQTIRLRISLDPGPSTGQDATWWLLAETPSGRFTFDFATGTWRPGTAPGYFGPLVSLSDRLVVARPAPAAGSVMFYFGVHVHDGGADHLYHDQDYDQVGGTVAAPGAQVTKGTSRRF